MRRAQLALARLKGDTGEVRNSGGVFLPPSVPRAGAVTQNAYMRRNGRQRYSPGAASGETKMKSLQQKR